MAWTSYKKTKSINQIPRIALMAKYSKKKKTPIDLFQEYPVHLTCNFLMKNLFYDTF